MQKDLSFHGTQDRSYPCKEEGGKGLEGEQFGMKNKYWSSLILKTI